MKKLLTVLLFALSASVMAQTYSKDLEKSAKNGDVAAQRDLGVCYLYGNGTKVNYQKAYDWLMRAAVNNDGTAQYHLGVMCENGSVGELKMYNMFTSSRASAAVYREIGGEGQTDGNYAFLIYELAYKNGSKDAPSKLYEYYKRSGMPNRAMQWLRKVAESGDKDYQFEYAKMLYTDDGKAIISSNPEAYEVFELIKLMKESYSKGEITKEQIDALFTEEGFKDAFSTQISSDIITNIFLPSKKYIFENDVSGSNIVLTLSKIEAKKWFEKAAAQGHKEAKDYLDRLIADGF